MLRPLMSRLLRADLKPAIHWQESDSLETISRLSMERPRLWSGRETVEQVLCKARDGHVLFKRWLGSGTLERIAFGREFQPAEMRIGESDPGPPVSYRLQLWPAAAAAVTCQIARPVWFGLWKNERIDDLGAGVCFVECADRDRLKELRFQLLAGKVPETLRDEEEMWERINALSDEDRRAACAALARQSFEAVDRHFDEQFPNAGPIPEELRPAHDAIQRKRREIERAADARPVDPMLAKYMERFVLGATVREAKPKDGNSPS